MADKLVTRAPHEGDAIWFLGGLYEVRVASDETGGATTVMQITVPEGAAPPPHIHSGAEVLYVIEGRIKQHLSGEVVEAGPGAIFSMPSGTLEWFEPIGTAKVLAVYTPGGIDKFFAEVGVPAERREVPPPMTEPPDLKRIIEVAERYGMQIQSPS